MTECILQIVFRMIFNRFRYRITAIKQSNLQEIKISANELKTKSGSFQNLNKLKFISFIDTKITIQKNTFNFPNSSVHFKMVFYICNTVFENGAFNGIESTVEFEFYSMNVSAISERAFKSILNNENNSIVFGSGSLLAEIDC